MITKNNMIHDNVEIKPKYTSCSSMPQPRVSIHRNAVVACVNGKPYDMYLQSKKKKENKKKKKTDGVMVKTSDVSNDHFKSNRTYRKIIGIPSMGQITPDSKSVG